MGFSYDGELLVVWTRHAIVMEKTAYLSRFPTIMTLTTVICGGFLGGRRLALTSTPHIPST
jgi:hypothetical protein